MATIMESDTMMWLNNKLGSDDDLWVAGGIASQFTSIVLKNICQCFVDLDSSLKIKTLLSMLEVPFRNLNQFSDDIQTLVRIAEEDSDDWVRVAASIVKDYPEEQTIDKNLNIHSFKETLEEITNEVGGVDISRSSYQLPLECQYLNKTALSRIIPEPAQPPKHFTLRRKPKSAALRAKITQKANLVANQRRLSSSLNSQPSSGKANLKRVNSLSVPISHSKSGLPKGNLTKKTKLLDIADQPLGVREQKKRKKILAMEMQQEETKQRKQNKATTEEQTTTTSVQKHEVPSDGIDHPSSGNETEADQSETDSSLVKVEDDSTDDHTSDAKDSDVPTTPAYMSSIPDISTFTSDNNVPLENTSSPNMLLNVPAETSKNNLSDLVNVDPNASLTTQNLQRELQMRMQEEQLFIQQKRQQQQQQMLNQQMLRNQQMQSYQQQAAYNQMALSSGLIPQNRFHPPFPQMQPPVNLHHTPHASSQQQQQQQQQQQKKVLSLSREKMLAAQEMFKSANCVERAEKALILAFMAGSRENPFPQQGPIITIKLSEHMENVPPTQQADGSVNAGQTTIIEMLFEMNFDTGLWRRLRRTRVVAQQQQQQQQTS